MLAITRLSNSPLVILPVVTSSRLFGTPPMRWPTSKSRAVFQRGEQIVRFEIGVVRQNLILRHSGGQKLKQVLDRISKSADDRLAVTDGRIGHDALQTRHAASLRHPHQLPPGSMTVPPTASVCPE